MSKQTQETLDSLNTLREQADETPDADTEASESSSDDRSSSGQGSGRKGNESSGDASSKRSARSEQDVSPVEEKSAGEDDGSAQSQARSDNEKPSGLLDEVMGTGPSKRPPKESITFSLPHALTERLRNMCYYERLTMSQVVEKAIRYAVEEVEERHNDGEPYSDRGGDLPTSRPKR
jgi:hypothetical protein